MKKKIALLAGLIFLGACQMQQDPLSGAPDAVRNGRPPNTAKPVQEKPLDKNALQIDAPSLVNGRVGSAVEFNILGRVMTPGTNYEISIDNLADFAGATFDSTTGEFKWTPVKSLMGGFPSVELPLRITMATVPTDDNPVVSVEKKTIALVIVNTYSKPIINSVDGSSPLVTGTRHYFAFKLEDVDAQSAKDVTIEIRDCDSYPTSVAHLVTVRRTEADGTTPGKYKGEVTLNLSSADLLRSDTYCFGLMAISKHGVVSEIYKKTFSIEAKMKPTKMTMEKALELTVGEKANVAFAIYDPTGAGKISVKSMDDIAQILPGSTLSCGQSWVTLYQLDCTGVIDTTAAQEKVYNIKFSIENTGARPSQTTITNHALRIQVKAAKP